MKTFKVDFPLWFRTRPLTYMVLFGTIFLALWKLDDMIFWTFLTIFGTIVPMTSLLDPFVDMLLTGPLEMNESVIRRRNLWASYEIKWDEIERIERPVNGSRWIHLYGRNKELAIYGPDLWSGRDRAAMLALFEAQIEKHAIPVERIRNGLWYKAHNTKVNRKRLAVKSGV